MLSELKGRRAAYAYVYVDFVCVPVYMRVARNERFFNALVMCLFGVALSVSGLCEFFVVRLGNPFDFSFILQSRAS